MLYLKTGLNVCRCSFTEKSLWRRGLSTTEYLSRTNRAHQKILSHIPHAQMGAVFLSQFLYCPAAFIRCGGVRGLFGGGRGNIGQQTLEDIAENIRERKFKRIVVMAGAGISTPSGIPDFRTPGSGLYDNLQQYNLPYAEAIFEINYFHHNPNPFFALAKELYPGNYQPNLTHYFIRLLHDKGQLLRMYTQNIDGLERMAGIPPKMLVEAHGTFATATCTVCRRDYEGEELRNDIMEGTIPKCPTCKGIIKPDIVFFGEELPQQFFTYLTDFPIADLLIVMGTSLEVEPFASLAGAVHGSVSRLLINRDLVGPFAWGSQRHNDVADLGDVVSGVKKLVELLGWKQELEALMNVGGDKTSVNKEE
ncbi:NAD-dependent protein deacetylase sirtuin-3-like isoform X1 [Sinocyclocheilus grahami]|uniref:NAD-dependent protein deacetylase sirtuin-3, mitochondrial-like n=3 Tax=Sinocyclocheilus grahami TaxID=75366 RepID=A0A672MAZ1_SINGR|nr:PREDICTED: NAD-dependent protein deacetylase sirtuin-3-like isoform X1 [Sinocyclocheilus grahami]